jgi:hypothetical protein
MAMRVPATRNGKVAIVEPPSQGVHRGGGGSNSGFPSPTRADRALPNLYEDQSRLMQAIQQSIPEAVRQVVRDNWDKTLLGTEFHQSFVVSLVALKLPAS